MGASDNQQKFDELHPSLDEGDLGKLQAWLEEVLEAPDAVRCYGTISHPSKQLKNKLGQAGDLASGVLVLSIDSKYAQSAVESLVENWAANKWATAVSCVALAYEVSGRWVIKDIIEWRHSRFPGRIRERLFPDVNMIVAKGSEMDLVGAAPRSIDELAASLYVSVAWLDEVLWLLNDKKGIIFYGPPGTGKTYLGLAIAEFIQPDPKLRRTVQLHPSYAYEDFFEGYRPADNQGGLTLVKRPGPLKGLASDLGEQKGVIVLDEINRGNLPRVFGELYIALEYRSTDVTLMYSPDTPFRLPPNLCFIGTMNTADRSVALLDQALRRRFHFIPLFPGEPPVDSMLRGYLGDHAPKAMWLADLLGEANRRLGDRNVAVGPSHFMRPDIDEKVARTVWKYSVLPTIEDQFFGESDRLHEFAFDSLRGRLTEGGGGSATD